MSAPVGARSSSTRYRVQVFAVLVATLVLVLAGRTFQLQSGERDAYAGAAADNRIRTVVDPAPRGLVLDQAGRPLAANRQVLQVVADLTTLYALPQDGREVLERLGGVLGLTFEEIDARLTPCSSPNAVPGTCWNGGAADPVLVVDDADPGQALAVLERPDDFPGITTQTVTVRSYPGYGGSRSAHLLGHLGPVTAEELEAAVDADPPGRAALSATDLVGRTGLEQQYDDLLAGRNGTLSIAVDLQGRTTDVLRRAEPVPGSTVVTSIDAGLQAVVEQQLAAAIERARASGERELAADTGSAVVVDVTDGRILAMASYPDYDPAIWTGGISDAQYQQLLDSGALLFNPVQGLYAPGSTFKPFTVAAMARAGYSLGGSYACPSEYRTGGRAFTNFESEGYGTISLQRAIEVSCNTVFYRVADELWGRTGGQDAGAEAADPVHDAAAAFGLGSRTGIDLPDEAQGQVSGRSSKYAQWLDRRDAWCLAAQEGYPQLRATDPAAADEFTALDAENCTSGGLWREGDALNAAIGQGLTAITPLQLAMGYAALANGGTLYQPQIAKAVVAPDGTVDPVEPVVASKVDVDASTLAFLRTAMIGVTTSGSASGAFRGFPLQQVPVASKTGSAQVSGGKPSTSWFASYAPADAPRYAIVMMVTQGGTGAGTSAPSVRAIYERLFGISGTSVDPAGSVLPGGAPATAIPTAPVVGAAPAPAPPPTEAAP
jgi:penicillin-binding protein 2